MCVMCNMLTMDVDIREQQNHYDGLSVLAMLTNCRIYILAKDANIYRFVILVLLSSDNRRCIPFSEMTVY